jgi:phosphoglucosamine mutase
VQKVLREVEDSLGQKGRVLLRYSGTENFARVMVEGEREELVANTCQRLAEEVSSSLN